MDRRALRNLAAVAAAILAFLLMPGHTYAKSTHDHPLVEAACHSSSGAEVELIDMVALSSWNCSDAGWRANQPVAWLRFDAQSWADKEKPRYFFTRNARFETITIGVLDEDGTLRSLRYSEEMAKPFAAGPVFRLELPEVMGDTSAVIVKIDKPHSVPLLTEARLSFHPEDASWTQLDMMLLALVVGMLVLPLFFDVSFFIVLRERFVVIHAMMVASMIVYVLFAGGLITVFADVPLWVMAVAGPLCWAIGCGLSALFLVGFLEEYAQSPFMRRLTLATGLWTILVPGFFALQLHATQPVDDLWYFYTFIPAMVIITAAIAEALWRGSKGARFLAVAWSPIILSSLERMLRGLGIYAGPSQLDQTLYLAVAMEVIVISLAIASRFLAIRRERDAAVTESKLLEQLSTHDPLTGLMNRRAVEERFVDLQSQGFDTFALVDLDHFKTINDRFGHQVGDKALVACGRALQGGDDRDTIAVRLGGEEFVVLLRGKGALERAEAMRQSITLRIARDVEGLERPVTASMGVIELPRASDQLMGFDDLYSRADQLLYNAKAAGRNRTCFERLTVFKSPPATRKAAGSTRKPGKAAA
ncbi:GGDEF domain-containing protein [Erythrobacter sp. KY5]|uniref:sensor domain-containing diguanylate cyclase n=1 Tax=Erythrobacter sp. KY5 TaxID=2011159 RepID=UPI000DBF285E|nr:diguanylate cyclase [Erythrobacter sp. KY5]AWW73434.1 GGDEF domain-containing protein [Erythrobacter sp. KY5]